MKYAILVGDGMADHPIEELGGQTPLEVARTPNMDYIAQYGRLGRIKTIPQDMPPASDVAHVSIFGFDPKKYYTGRGPLEAANLGIDLADDDVVFRCNLISVSEDDRLIDYSAGHINSQEAAVLIKLIEHNLGTNRMRFFPGVSYRHLMVIKRGMEEHFQNLKCKPPHDIIGQKIRENLPKGDNADILIKLMRDSYQILQQHEINMVRIDLKENPANMIWLWGQGQKSQLPNFREKFGLSGGVISAVDLIKGLGKILGLETINVSGATGYYDTDYAGKAKAALEFLEKGDFIFVHVEAPDEAGHNGHLREKIAAIENFDQFVVGKILNSLRKKSEDFRILVLPDHATPVAVRTHTAEPVCFGIIGKNIIRGNFLKYSEKEAEKSELYFEKGYELLPYFIKNS